MILIKSSSVEFIVIGIKFSHKFISKNGGWDNTSMFNILSSSDLFLSISDKFASDCKMGPL